MAGKHPRPAVKLEVILRSAVCLMQPPSGPPSPGCRCSEEGPRSSPGSSGPSSTGPSGSSSALFSHRCRRRRSDWKQRRRGQGVRASFPPTHRSSARLTFHPGTPWEVWARCRRRPLQCRGWADPSSGTGCLPSDAGSCWSASGSCTHLLHVNKTSNLFQ